MYVTYSDLFQFCLVLIGLAGFVYRSRFQHKKEIAARTLRKSAAIS